MIAADELIARHRLIPHPEGGHYRETYRSEMVVETATGRRSAGTAILYLLKGDEVSRFHRIDADEIWHFHEGGPLDIHILEEGGGVSTKRLSATTLQVIVPKGCWFGASLAERDGHCLVGCTVNPGFEFEGFELAEKELLLEGWPQAAALIERLT